MNAGQEHNPHTQEQLSTPVSASLIKSIIFHGIIFLVTFVGFPLIQKDPVIITPMSVELVDISELSQAQKKPPPKPQPIEKPKPPEPKEELPKPKPPEVKAEPKQPDPVPPPKPKEEPKKEPEKPKPKPPEPKPEPKKEEPKKEPEKDFSSLLKDLTPREEEPDSRPSENPDVEDGSDAPIVNQISISELDALRAQLEPCWNIPAGAKYAEDLAVRVKVIMNRDMSIYDTRVIDQGRYNRDPSFRAAADSALRALRNPRCTPLKLPPNKYDQWKTILINFDPRDVL